jgi:hypothetical protein
VQEALSVVECVAGMSQALDVPPVSLLQLQLACRFPLRSAVLPTLYVGLLRTCMLEVIAHDAPRALPHARARCQL